MSAYIPLKLRELVAKRAAHRCEYCLMNDSDAYITFHVDHIISLRHGGETVEENLAYACIYCNRWKGSDVGTILIPEREFTRFFNPRLDDWAAHFKWDNLEIVPLTNIGAATIKILDLNHFERIMERQLLKDAGRFLLPPE